MSKQFQRLIANLESANGDLTTYINELEDYSDQIDETEELYEHIFKLEEFIKTLPL